MTEPPIKTLGQPVLIIGGGRGGSALLEMFLEDEWVSIVAVVDPNPDAKGLILARQHEIPTFPTVTDALRAGQLHENCIIYNLTHDDSVIDEVAALSGNHRITGGAEAKIFWQMVTHLRHTKHELEKNQTELRAIIQNATDGILTINEAGEIQGFNPAAETIFGYRQSEIKGKKASQLVPGQLLAPRSPPDEPGALAEHSQELVGTRKDGTTFPLELSLSEMVLAEQRYQIGIVRDITERKETEKRIQFLAHHDFLTKLPNRALFQDRLEQSMTLAQRNQTLIALLLIDLDGFKGVNDNLGHDQGDELLIQVAKRLKGAIRKSDTVARLGGDEFSLILNDLKLKADAQPVAQNVIQQLSLPFLLNGSPCSIGCSIGIAVAPLDSSERATLIKQADEAMYQSKRQGKGCFTYWKNPA